MKIWETIKLGRGKLQLYTSRCFTLTDEDGNIEYYGIKNSAKYQPSSTIKKVDEDRIGGLKLGKKTKEVIDMMESFHGWADFRIVQKDDHTIDVIVDDYSGEQVYRDIENGDILLRIKTY